MWPLALDYVDVHEPHHVSAVFHDEGDVPIRLDVWVQCRDEGLIKVVAGGEAHGLKPEARDFAADEVTVCVINPTTGHALGTASLQVLDPVTGDAFGKAVETNYRGLWRLQPPSAGRAAPVRTTLQNGDVTINQIAARSPAKRVRILYAYPTSALTFYVSKLGELAAPSKGHIWVLAQYLDDEAEPPAWSSVGCSTILSDTGIDLLHTNPKDGLADPDATVVNPRIPTAYAFNVAQGSHTITADLDGHTVSATIPAITPGAFHVVHLTFLASEVGENPAVAGCYTDATPGWADESTLSATTAAAHEVIHLENASDHLVDIYRVEGEGERRFIGSILAGEEAFLLSTPTQAYVMADDDAERGVIVVTRDGGVGSGSYESLSSCISDIAPE